MFKALAKVILTAALLFVSISFNLLLWGAELDLPLPADARKTDQKDINIGPAKSLTQFYETSVPADKLSAFYKIEMGKSGWQQEKDNFFSKDRDFVVIAVLPKRSKEDKTRFSIITTTMPTEQEVKAARKTNPDKLDFMPVYPGSVQVFLWDTPSGVSGSYETKSGIRDVLFFYKSGMLNYGWNLSNEIPILTEEIDCPECKKMKVSKANIIQPNMSGASSRASLEFRRGDGETCLIRLYETKYNQPQSGIGEKKADNAQDSDIIPPIEGKTQILVTYNDIKLLRKK